MVKEDQAREHLAKINVHKSTGSDGMHPHVLRELAEVITELLSIIFGRSWQMGEMPEDRRIASVTPVFKKGKKADLGNYRLVSLTSIPGEVMEQLVLDVLSKQLEEKKVTVCSQHGSTRGKPCLTNLTTFCDVITSWVDGGRAVDAVCLDFSKAFDTVFHTILVLKLRTVGIDEWMVKWIDNWLTGRAQEVVISGAVWLEACNH